jgi:hypothetical protein
LPWEVTAVPCLVWPRAGYGGHDDDAEEDEEEDDEEQ